MAAGSAPKLPISSFLGNSRIADDKPTSRYHCLPVSENAVLQDLFSTWVAWLYTGSDMHVGAFVLGATLALGVGDAACQEYSVKAVDVGTGKALSGMPITLRYDCSYTGTGIGIKAHCKFIQRKTGLDGVAHFPEAGSLGKIDDIFSLPVTYGAVCCDIQPAKFPGIGTITFKRRTISEMMHWIFVGD